MQNVDMGVAYSCLKYDVFITTRFYCMRIVYKAMSVHGHENLHFDPISFGGRVNKRCSMFARIAISMVVYVF